MFGFFGLGMQELLVLSAIVVVGVVLVIALVGANRSSAGRQQPRHHDE